MDYGYRLTPSGLMRVDAKIGEKFTGKVTQEEICEYLEITRNTYRRLLQKDKKITNVSLSSIRDIFVKLELDLTQGDYEVGVKADVAEEDDIYPFFWPNPIRQPYYFRGRKRELSLLRTAHNMEGPRFQIEGGRKVGKTSLLEHSRHLAKNSWKCEPIYLNGSDTSLHSVEGFCKHIATELDVNLQLNNMEALHSAVDDRINAAAKNAAPLAVLYLDDFHLFFDGMQKSLEGETEFWEGFASIIRHGLVFITTTRIALIHVFKDFPDRVISDFFGVTMPINLRGFTEAEAKEFVAEKRSGGFTFLPKDQECILEKVGTHQYHPLALQIFCSFIYDLREDGRTDINRAVAEAEAEFRLRVDPNRE